MTGTAFTNLIPNGMTTEQVTESAASLRHGYDIQFARETNRFNRGYTPAAAAMDMVLRHICDQADAAANPKNIRGRPA